jgi:hypothetical protein
MLAMSHMTSVNYISCHKLWTCYGQQSIYFGQWACDRVNNPVLINVPQCSHLPLNPKLAPQAPLLIWVRVLLSSPTKQPFFFWLNITRFLHKKWSCSKYNGRKMRRFWFQIARNHVHCTWPCDSQIATSTNIGVAWDRFMAINLVA